MRTFRPFVALLVGLSVATPATAQFKKLKDALGKKPDAKPSVASAPAPDDGSVIVVTPEVVDRLLLGFKAAQAERDKAAKEDTPYGRYVRARSAYDIAKPKCEAAHATWAQRVIADERLGKVYDEKLQKAIALQGKGDMVAYETAMYDALSVIDPACGVREPKQPDDMYDAKRGVDERANKANRDASGFNDREYGLVSDRVIAILNGTEPPGGASSSEKSAVSAKDPELKSGYGIREAQAERVAKQAPAPAPPPAAATAPSGPAVAVNDCMVKNVQAHEDEIRALGDRGTAAQEAGNTALMMAIADTIQRIQMAGCNK